MINIELKIVDNPLRQKIEKLKLYRLSLLIQSDIEEFADNYYNYNYDRFSFVTFKDKLSVVLDKFGIEYKFDYLYDKTSDNIKVYIGKCFVLNFVITSTFDYDNI